MSKLARPWALFLKAFLEGYLAYDTGRVLSLPGIMELPNQQCLISPR